MKKSLITAIFIGLAALPAVLFAQIRTVPPYPIFHDLSAVKSGTGVPLMLSPNGGEFWRIGEVRQIRWAQNGCSTYLGSCRYDLYLVSPSCSDVMNCNVNPIPLEKNMNYYAGDWPVGQLLDNSYIQGVYKMAICASGSYILCDVSDGSFTINGSAGGNGGSTNPGTTSTITYLSPANGSTIPVSDQRFYWNAVSGASEYWVQFGSYEGGNDIYTNTTGQSTQIHLFRFPTNINKIYFRLWYRVGNNWAYRDFYYFLSNLSQGSNGGSNNPGGNVGSISYVYPSAGTILPSSTTMFVWNSVPYATAYRIQLGSNKGSGEIIDRNTGSGLFANVTNIPTDGRTLYLRISYYVFDNWYYNDFSYQAPNAGSTLSITLRTTLAVGQPITAPATIPLEASVNSSNSIAYVDFFEDDYRLLQDTSTPFSMTATNVSAGTHVFTAVVTDSRGVKLTSSPLYVYVGGVSSLNPTLDITPQSSVYRAPALVVLSLRNNIDQNRISRVVFYQNGSAVDEDRTFPYQFAISALGAGNYNFGANVYDQSGNLLGSSNQISISVSY